ncbi:hypothetical protein LEMLEM_LOCUS19262 [Lemmus lemmus]
MGPLNADTGVGFVARASRSWSMCATTCGHTQARGPSSVTPVGRPSPL